jgi:hypothetical protein
MQVGGAQMSGGPERQPALAGPSPAKRMVNRGRWSVRGRSRSSRRHHPPLAGLHWNMGAALTATLRGDPIEHGNIRVVESSRQARNGATGPRYHNLRTRDARGNARNSGARIPRDRPQFSDSMNSGLGL